MYVWNVDEDSKNKAIEKVEMLKRIHSDRGIERPEGYDSTLYGYIGELSFVREARLRDMDIIYLSNNLHEDGSGDDGDVLIDGLKYNIKVQTLWEDTTPKAGWDLNINRDGYLRDTSIGVDVYQFLVYNVKRDLLYDVGTIPHSVVPLIGEYKAQGDRLRRSAVSKNMYCVPLELTRQKCLLTQTLKTCH